MKHDAVHRLVVCASCAPPDGPATGQRLVAALREMLASGDPGLSGYVIETGECMQACTEPQALAFQAAGKAQYLFSNVDANSQTDEISAFALLYRQSAGGVIDDARACGQLRFCLRGKLPALQV